MINKKTKPKIGDLVIMNRFGLPEYGKLGVIIRVTDYITDMKGFLIQHFDILVGDSIIKKQIYNWFLEPEVFYKENNRHESRRSNKTQA